MYFYISAQSQTLFNVIIFNVIFKSLPDNYFNNHYNFISNNPMKNNLFINGYIVENNDLNRIQTAISQLRFQRSEKLVGQFSSIMAAFFGNHDNKGVLLLLAEQAYRETPVNWIQKVQKAVNMIGPDSQFVKILLSHKHLRQTVEKSNLPGHLQNADFDNINSIISIRSRYEGVSLAMLQWYFATIINRIYHSESLMHKVTFEQAMLKDDFFYHLTRNPLLILFRKVLQHFSKGEQSLKLIELVKLYLVEPLIIKHKQNLSNRGKFYSKNHFRYDLRKNSILALFLCLRWQRQPLQDLEVFFQAAISMFREISQRQDDNLTYLVRLWLYFNRSAQAIQSKMIDATDKANQKQGWFELQRYDINELSESTMSKINIKKFPNFRNLAISFIDLYVNEASTHNTVYSFFTFSSFVYFVAKNIKSQRTYGSPGLYRSNTNNFNQINPSEKMQTSVNKISKLLQDVLKRQKSRLKTPKFQQLWQIVTTLLSKLQESFFVIYDKKINSKINYQNLDLNISHDASFYSTTAEDSDQKFDTYAPPQRKSLLTYYRNYEKNYWGTPLKENESYILFKILQGIAIGADKIIPGRREEPFLKIRWMANPILCLIAILIVYLVLKMI